MKNTLTILSYFIIALWAINPLFATADESVSEDSIFDYQFTLNASIDKVWPVFLQQDKWLLNYDIELLSGDYKKVGAIRKIKYKSQQALDSAYIIETIKVEEPVRFVTKAYTLDDADYGEIKQFFGYDDFKLFDEGGKTRVEFNSYIEFLSNEMTQEEIERYVTTLLVNARKEWSMYVKQLDELLRD